MEEFIVSLAYGIVGAIWKIFHLRNLERDQKARLLLMLNDPNYFWRSISAMSANIAANQETTKRLLVQINARQSKVPPYYWGLIDRVGPP
jgi:hypothetical protein